MSPSDKPGAAGSAQAYPKRWTALAVMMLANFMNLLDVTIVNVALPSLQSGLGATSSEIEWVVAGYVLVFALGLLPFGRLGDVRGKKRVFLAGVGAFTFASLLCGLAPGIDSLIAARLLQGAGAAIMTPQVLAIAQMMFPPKERAAAFSLFGLSAGLASVSGPLLGGWLISLDLFGLGWRPIFLINIPVGLVTILLGWRLIPALPVRPGLKNDLVGIVLAAFAIFCVIFPLIEGRGFGWPAWCFAMLALSVPFAIAFALWERRQHRTKGPELLPLNLMTNRNYVIGTLMTATFFSTLPGFFLTFAMFLQQGFGFTPLQSGLTTVPFSSGIFVASLISGRLGNITPRLRVITGVLMVIVGMAALRYQVLGFGDVADRVALLPWLLLSGLGMGIAIAPMFQLVLAGVPPHDAGSGSGALQAIQQVGSALGIAIVSQIFFADLSTNVAAGMANHAAYIHALATGLFYNFAGYTLVLVAVLLMRAQAGPAVQERPLPVE
ncbi:DHA2 family efflux MFS transporter permease subunit [Rhizobium sp. AG855]|uniref:DHA2 family efflux MFS transporter permease subunit n=1 Tax=Rhizobium sp. AG855 TaxID=2183898 RepID=UPI000E712E74|nr:DHA2 family efflux MFS transporter permease subunit [Rhizobium sp. AG855]RKE86410.1 EmrB/QacA subfamily drug resistance transporter [Rhizobium sp. AG855]